MGTERRWGDKSSGLFYSWKDRDFVSVTTAINVIDKPALRYWVGKMVATKAVELTKSGELARLLGEFGTDGATQLLKNAPYADMERKADVGTAVHKRVEAMILGQPLPEPPAELKGFMKSFDDFTADNDVQFEAAETTVYSQQYGYAGTLDILCKLAGVMSLGDVKTGKGVYPEVALQLAAYRYADFVGLDDGTEAPIADLGIKQTFVLHLRPRGYKIVPVRTDLPVFVAFRAALALWKYQRNTAPNVLGASA